MKFSAKPGAKVEVSVSAGNATAKASYNAVDLRKAAASQITLQDVNRQAASVLGKESRCCGDDRSQSHAFTASCAWGPRITPLLGHINWSHRAASLARRC